MKQLTPNQVVAISFIAILILNLILLALKKIEYKVFWMVIVIAFGVSYIIKKSEEKYG